jgi:S1-C subfamily serine protease
MRFKFLILAFLMVFSLPAQGSPIYETSSSEQSQVELEVSEISNSISKRLVRRMTDAAVKVSSPDGSYGTGTYFRYKSRRFVLTARHVVEGDSQIFIDLDPFNRVPATVVYLSETRDIAILACDELVGKKPMRLRTRDSTLPGQNLFYSGFPSRHSLLTITGVIAGYENWGESKIIMHSYGWPGASGSGVFDDRGRLVGVLIAVDVSRMVVHPHSAHRIVEDIVWVEPISDIPIADIVRSIE